MEGNVVFAGDARLVERLSAPPSSFHGADAS